MQISKIVKICEYRVLLGCGQACTRVLKFVQNHDGFSVVKDNVELL